MQAALTHWYKAYDPDEDDIIDMRRALTAALPHLTLSSAPCSVEVKRLEWEQTSFGTPEVFSAVGVYRIVSAWNGGWSLTRNNNTILDHDGRSNFPTIEAAKEAAQADFERRILSQIVTKPVDVAAVREAAEKLIHNRFDTYTAKNGKRVSIEGDDGEMCWIVSFEDMFDLENAIRALSPAEPAQGEQFPQDVIDLVIAAREVMYGGYINVIAEEVNTFDKALEAFASRIPWDDEPEAPTISAGRTTEGGEV